MDFQFWIWLIVIVITLIARANKKKQGEPPAPHDQPDPSGNQQPSQPPKAITFEDLLREIQGEKVLSKPVAVEPKQKEYDFVDYDDDIPDEIQEFKDEEYNISKDEQVFQAYEAAQKQALKRPLIEEASKIGRVMRSEHFKEYDLKERNTSFDFLSELKNPKGFKKAFIMSEILNKRY